MKTLTTYEIYNPSDPMTIQAPSHLIAAVAVAIMGNGKLGIEGTPILFGWAEWLAEQGIEDLSEWINGHRESVAAALRSVALGGVHERADYDAAIAAIDCPEKKKTFIADRNDRRRTSVSDWEAHAHRLADAINQQN